MALEELGVAVLEVMRILQMNDVFTREVDAREEAFPVLWLDVELPDGLVAVDMARGPHGDNVGVRSEDLVCDRAVELALGILVKDQWYNVLKVEGLARDGVVVVLL